MKIRKKMQLALALTCMSVSAGIFGACTLLPMGSSSSSPKSNGELAFELTPSGTGYTLIGIGKHGGGDVVVPETYQGLPITRVRYDAFDYYDKLTSITLPDTVTIIEENAFGYCENLESITFGSGLQTIETNAFVGCESLTSVTFGDALQTIGEEAFIGCSALESITFGAAETELKQAAFQGCSALTEIDFGGVRTIGRQAFQACSGLQKVDLKKVRRVDDNAFTDCSLLQTLDMGTHLSALGSRAFGSCSKLEKVIAPTTLASLTPEHFSGSNKVKNIYVRGSEAECQYKASFTDIGLYFYAESDPFADGNVDFTTLYWHMVNGETVHWNKKVGSSCVILKATDTGAYTIKTEDSVKKLQFNGATNTSVTATDDGIAVDKAMLYNNPGVHTITWRNEVDTLHVYVLKALNNATLNFEDGQNLFIRSMSEMQIDGVKAATATTGNGNKSLQITGKGGSIYMGLDADYVHAVFADSSVKKLQFKIYTPYDIRQKLAWYYMNYKIVDGQSVMVGNQITTNISYEDKGDYLLISWTRDGYNRWKASNVYMDTDVCQFLFRFTRDLFEGETPTTGGQDTTTKYRWINPGVFYIDDVCGVK